MREIDPRQIVTGVCVGAIFALLLRPVYHSAMADPGTDVQMSEDFTSDYTGNEGFNSGEAITQENGKKSANGGGDGKDSGAAEAPGRDDER